jgi:hypothetical protein
MRFTQGLDGRQPNLAGELVDNTYLLAVLGTMA